MRSSVILLGATLPAGFAIFSDEAYRVDFHYTLLGLPQSANTFFHQPSPVSKASLVYTLSEKSVLGAVNPKDGGVVWRQALSVNQSQTSGYLRVGADQDTLISAIGGSVKAWSASDGRLVWDQVFDEVHVQGLDVLEVPRNSDSTTTKDAVVLFANGIGHIHLLNGNTGAVKWTYKDDRYCRPQPTPRTH